MNLIAILDWLLSFPYPILVFDVLFNFYVRSYNKSRNMGWNWFVVSLIAMAPHIILVALAIYIAYLQTPMP